MKSAMSARLFILTLFVMSTFVFASASHADPPSYGMPASINASAKYLFFFHNLYVETKGTDGDCKYYDILKAFTDKGYIVISEIRPKDASISECAKKSAGNIQKLLDAGVPAENIIVSGHSKGGVIAIQVASLLENPKVKYVIMAGCAVKGLEKAYPDSKRLKGNFLSVYASSDKVAGSCNAVFSQAKQDFASKEFVLDSAAGHQLFFKPTDVWLEPVMGWLKQK
jgi:predicted esterase